MGSQIIRKSFGEHGVRTWGHYLKELLHEETNTQGFGLPKCLKDQISFTSSLKIMEIQCYKK